MYQVPPDKYTPPFPNPLNLKNDQPLPPPPPPRIYQFLIHQTTISAELNPETKESSPNIFTVNSHQKKEVYSVIKKVHIQFYCTYRKTVLKRVK